MCFSSESNIHLRFHLFWFGARAELKILHGHEPVRPFHPVFLILGAREPALDQDLLALEGILAYRLGNSRPSHAVEPDRLGLVLWGQLVRNGERELTEGR